ncbi:MAG: hypothetical protein D6732_02385 [Methanobacteriota archaeon]|nr:MAG: hypothetical protein D6732_02385 [Euryarchaeota archaeon]
MHNHKFSALFICMMITFINFSPIMGNTIMTISDLTTVQKNGVPGRVLGSVGSLRDCTDPALVKMQCNDWLSHVPEDGNYGGTVLIFDDGLSVSNWQDLENGFYGMSVDIVGYLTPDDQGNIPNTLIGEIGQDTLQGITDADLDYLGSDDHAIAVISALGTIARKAKVLFVNARYDGEPIDSGFYLTDNEIWRWIANNVENYNIKVISTSFNVKDFPNFDSTVFDYIYAQGVFMATSIGNKQRDDGDDFPQFHPYVYAVGSIDHETRTKSNDPNYYYSKENKYSGDNDACNSREQEERTHTLCASYGYWDFNTNPSEALDFVMPGNGVPVAFNPTLNQIINGYVLRYDKGTSFSAPYLAATALVAIYAYSQGYYSVAGRLSYPSVSQIYDLLKDNAYSPYTGWDRKLGWGMPLIMDVYGAAYGEGAWDATSTTSGGGWNWL